MAGSIATGAPVTLTISGDGAKGAFNIINFDNEINEPNAFPPSRQHVDPSQGNSSSHGFPYFQYRYDDANPDSFNNYANEDEPELSLWSIIVSSHVVAGEDYWRGLLKKAGAVSYGSLTTNTVVPHANPGVYNLGALTYDWPSLTGIGLEVVPASAVTLAVSRTDYNFNSLNESTTPGTWTGYPYYYWGVDMNYTLAVRNLTGPGLLFRDGKLVGIELKAVAEVKNYAGTVTWPGTLRLTERGFTYDVNASRYLSGLGDLHIVFDRSGPVALPGVVPELAGQLKLENPGGVSQFKLQAWPSYGYRIERSTDLKTWTTHAWCQTDSTGAAILPAPTEESETSVFYRAARLAPGETPPVAQP